MPIPVDGGDDGHGEIAPLQEDRMVGVAQPIAVSFGPFGEIGAGAEAAPRAGDQETAHLGPSGPNLGDGLAHAFEHDVIDGVQHLRTVQCHDCDGIVDIERNSVEFHGGSFCPVARGTLSRDGAKAVAFLLRNL